MKRTDDDPIALADTVADTESDERAEALPRGATVGRYVILDHLGSGGMGIVHRAYDPQLDRAIAIKILRVRSEAGSDGDGPRTRMLREAQALARLSHPNVVSVYDAGVEGHDLFIAMELVEGKTLRDWLRAEERSVEEVIGRLVEAGRGLAAAHRSGIIHRDFKPDNVLVGDDGRVRVADFGLAGAAGVQPVSRSPSSDGAALDTPLTRTGQHLGTPHYMAPEQFEKRTVDAAADQFAFCVTAYEALYGERPFEGDSVPELMERVSAGDLRPLPERPGIPARVREALLRGLQADPARRFPSMEAVLEELRPAPRHGRRWMYGGAVALVLGGIVTTALAVRAADRPAPCSGARERLAGAWDERVSEAVRQSFLASDRPYAADTFERFAAAAESRASAWTTMRTEACEATQRGEQSAHLMDLRMHCLDRRRAELGALTTALAAEASPEAVDRALEAISELAPVSRCANTAAVLESAPPPSDPQLQHQVPEVRALLDRARAISSIGRLEDGLVRAREATELAATIGYAPLEAEALAVRGELEDAMGDYEASEASFAASARAAAEAGDEGLLAEAFIKLMWNAGPRRSNLAQAQAYARASEALTTVARQDHIRARYLLNAGSLLELEGKYQEARDRLREALTLFEEAYGADDLSLAAVHNALAHAESNLGDESAAVRSYQRALELREQVLGPNHPDVAGGLNNLALAARRQGQYDQSMDYARRALAVLKNHPDHPSLGYAHQTLGLALADKGQHREAIDELERALELQRRHAPDSPDEADVRNSLGFSLRALGRPEEALSSHREALRIYRSSLGEKHPRTGDTLISMGLALVSLGRHAEAEASYREALAIYEKALGPDDPRVAVLLTNLGDTANERGGHDDALGYCKRAFAIDQATLGEDHPDLAYDLACMADSAAHLRRWADAIEWYERAIALRAAADGDPAELANTRFKLARALWDSGRDRKRARELARAAEKGHSPGTPERRQVAAWLAAR